MDKQDRHRLVQQYVERQKAYLPTYTTEHLLNERHRTPSKPLRSDEFGFDTPVLRPRNKGARSQLTLQAGARKSRTHGAERGSLGPAPPGVAPSEAQDTAPGKKDKPRSKRKKASTPIGSDNDRAARLADRRERKRKKRAIVNPPQGREDDTAAPQKGRANSQKAKKPTALALLYGLSATNVTKERLTLKPAPFLGVFSKGKASAKKKVTTTGKKSSSRNELFSESAFLNKPSERITDHSRIDDDSDGSSVSSISNHPMPRVIRAANRTKEDRGRCAESPAVKTPKVSAHTAAESEVWDIEVQSKLPSSACDVSSDPEVEDSAPVVLDLRGAEWAATINMTGECETRRTKTGTPSLSVTQSRVCVSQLAVSDIHHKRGLPHVVDAPSIHPSHSASQVGRRAADVEPSDLCLAASRYFTEPKPATVQEFPALAPQTPRSDDVLDSQMPGQNVKDATSDVQTIQREEAPSINTLTSIPQPLAEFQTRYDMVPLEFPSDGSPWDDCCARVDVPWQPLGGPDGGYFESSAVDIQSDPSIHHPHQSTTWDWCQPWHHSADLTTDDVEDVPVEALQGGYDPLALESIVEPCFSETEAEHDGEERFSGQWICTTETGHDDPGCEDVPVGGSICDSEESLGYGEPGENVPGFLEGRALLLGVPEDHRERPWCVGLSGLVQAEMDVASQLRDHWRPLRL